jgi:diaminopimelate epimerase
MVFRDVGLLHVICEQVVKIREREFKFSSVSTGVPHTVIYVDDVANFPVAKFGAALEQYRHYWPRGTNVEFVEIKDRHTVIQRTWERGCGETLSCGTGACAVCVVGVLTGRTDPKVTIQLNGGNLICEWNGSPLLTDVASLSSSSSPSSSYIASASNGQSVIMTGPATCVYSGTIAL